MLGESLCIHNYTDIMVKRIILYFIVDGSFAKKGLVF